MTTPLRVHPFVFYVKPILYFFVFIIPFSLFSFKAEDFELYPSFILLPLGVLYIADFFYRGFIPVVNLYRKWFLFFILYLTFLILFKPFIVLDLLKLFYLLIFYLALDRIQNQYGINLLSVLEKSLFVLVIYGVFQYLSLILGHPELASALKGVVNPSIGTAFDLRGGFSRVASLTWEPSYFAFTVGVGLFLVRGKLNKMLCLIGLAISFSLITVYVLFGLLLYKLFRYFKISLLYYYAAILSVHLLFIEHVYNKIPRILSKTFEDRYAALASSFNFSPIEFFIGSMDVNPSYQDNLYRPYSNIGSVVYLLGLLGYFFYALFFHSLWKTTQNKTVVISLFLFMFNFYYLTSWPVIVLFVFLIISNQTDISKSIFSDQDHPEYKYGDAK